jgi:hypothetical protein
MIRYSPRSSRRQECPVTRSPRRWAVSPLDFCVHLLPEGGHLPGGCQRQPKSDQLAASES